MGTETQVVQRKVAPDSLRVSYFYKALSFQGDRAAYRKALGTLFIPAWTQLTAPLGLTAYVPSVPPRVAATPQVPDEIAIVFFESQQVYNDIKKTTGGRLCGSTLHNCVFAWKDDPDPVRKSNSAFPIRMPEAGKAALNYSHEEYTPYYVFDDPADWFHGVTDVYIGVRPENMTLETYSSLVHGQLDDLRKNRPAGLEGLIFIILRDCLIFWAHWESAAPGQDGLLGEVKRRLRAVMSKRSDPRTVPASLSDSFAGFPDLADGDSYAIQFERRAE